MPWGPPHAPPLQWRGWGATRSVRRGLPWLHDSRVYFPEILEHGRHPNSALRADLWYLPGSTGFHQKLAPWAERIRRGSPARPTIISNWLFEYHDELIRGWSVSPHIAIKPACQLILSQWSLIWGGQRFKYDVWLILTKHGSQTICLKWWFDRSFWGLDP